MGIWLKTLHDSVITTDHVTMFNVEALTEKTFAVIATLNLIPTDMYVPRRCHMYVGETRAECLVHMNNILARLERGK